MKYLSNISKFFTKKITVQDCIDVINDQYNLDNIANRIKISFKKYELFTSRACHINFPIHIKKSSHIILHSDIPINDKCLSNITIHDLINNGRFPITKYNSSFNWFNINQLQMVRCDSAILEINISYVIGVEPDDLVVESLDFLTRKYGFSLSNNVIDDTTKLVYSKKLY